MSKLAIDRTSERTPSQVQSSPEMPGMAPPELFSEKEKHRKKAADPTEKISDEEKEKLKTN